MGSFTSRIGYLGEILRYANVIGGLDETQKRELRTKLEIIVDVEESKQRIRAHYDKDFFLPMIDRLAGKMFLVGFDLGRNRKPDYVCCIELCPEYIDYLKRILKPYLK